MARFHEWCDELEAALAEPFPEECWQTLTVASVQVPYVPWWRYAERLNDLVGPHGWSVGELRAQVYGSPQRMVLMLPLTILGVTKVQVGEDVVERIDRDTGELEPVEGYGGPGQRAYASALKRACSLFGMGLADTYDKVRRGRSASQTSGRQKGADGEPPAATKPQIRKIRALLAEREVSDDELMAIDARIKGGSVVREPAGSSTTSSRCRWLNHEHHVPGL